MRREENERTRDKRDKREKRRQEKELHRLNSQYAPPSKYTSFVVLRHALEILEVFANEFWLLHP